MYVMGEWRSCDRPITITFEEFLKFSGAKIDIQVYVLQALMQGSQGAE